MHGIIHYIAKNHQRHLAVFIAFVVVILTSCAFKGSIKSLAGVPVNTEQDSAKKNPLVGNGVEACAYGEITDAKIAAFSSNTNDLLPAALLVTTLFFLVGYAPLAKAPSHAGYAANRCSNSLPIFLQHRQLII